MGTDGIEPWTCQMGGAKGVEARQSWRMTSAVEGGLWMHCTRRLPVTGSLVITAVPSGCTRRLNGSASHDD
jgi:hypothetical protein